MRKFTNFIILGSIFLIFVGMLIFVITLSINKWDFNVFSSSNVITNTYELTDEFYNIEIEESTCDVNITYINEGVSKIIAKEYTNRVQVIEVIDNTLKIKEEDNRAWYEKLFDFVDLEMTIYLNINELDKLNINISTGDVDISDKFIFNYVTINGSTADVDFNGKVNEDLKIDLSTGDIELNNVICNNLDVKVSTGDIEIENLNCNSSLSIKVSTGKVNLNNVKSNDFYSSGSTGRINLTNVLVHNVMIIERDTGDVKFDKCDAGEIKVKTSTGDVEGTLLSNKIFNVDTDTGKKKVPESVSGGKCNITTDTGDVIIEIISK